MPKSQTETGIAIGTDLLLTQLGRLKAQASKQNLNKEENKELDGIINRLLAIKAKEQEWTLEEIKACSLIELNALQDLIAHEIATRIDDAPKEETKLQTNTGYTVKKKMSKV